MYLEILPDPSKVCYIHFIHRVVHCSHPCLKDIQLDGAGMVMIFLKHFDAATQSLFGTGKIHIKRVSRVSDLIPIINEKMGWASGTPLKLYEVSNDTFY